MYFHLNKSINKRLRNSLVIALVFAVGLSLYFFNQNIFTNFKFYYAKSYLYTGQYRLNQVASLGNTLYVSGDEIDPKAESVPVLVYHSLVNKEENIEQSQINIKKFWDQMKTLKENGWQTVTLQDLYDFKTGKTTLPPKSFVITFDDGLKDGYYPTNPILRTLGFKAAMFVIERYSLSGPSNYYLTYDELIDTSNDSSWEIQSHGYSSHSEYVIDERGNKGHFFSNRLWLPELKRIETIEEFTNRIRDDLQMSKDGLEKAFDEPVFGFAFPSGDYGGGTINFPGSQEIILDVSKKIYPLVFYQYSNVYRYDQNYPEPEKINEGYEIKRINVSNEWSGEDLIKILEKSSAKKLPFNAKFTSDDGWLNTDWGKMELLSNKLSIGSFDDSTGSTIILDGSNSWTNYKITAEVRWIKGSNIYLAARYRDDDNLTMCNFINDRVHVEQVYKGDSRVISGVENEFNPGQDIFTISMEVKGRTVSCAIDGRTIVSTNFLNPELSRGGIGIKTWDEIRGNSELDIYKFYVEQI